jgi:hypothetical protein
VHVLPFLGNRVTWCRHLARPGRTYRRGWQVLINATGCLAGARHATWYQLNSWAHHCPSPSPEHLKINTQTCKLLLFVFITFKNVTESVHHGTQAGDTRVCQVRPEHDWVRVEGQLQLCKSQLLTKGQFSCTANSSEQRMRRPNRQSFLSAQSLRRKK